MGLGFGISGKSSSGIPGILPIVSLMTFSKLFSPLFNPSINKLIGKEGLCINSQYSVEEHDKEVTNINEEILWILNPIQHLEYKEPCQYI